MVLKVVAAVVAAVLTPRRCEWHRGFCATVVVVPAGLGDSQAQEARERSEQQAGQHDQLQM
jgi:hypothetical protein